MIYALNPKNYTSYRNHIMQNKQISKKHRKKIKKPKFIVLNYKYLLTERKYINL
jgi:hypothetical protein